MGVVFRERAGGGLVGLVGQVGPRKRRHDPHGHTHHPTKVKNATTPAPVLADQHVAEAAGFAHGLVIRQSLPELSAGNATTP
jgi:hypothetical protein